MADINHPGPARTEGDGISYRGLGWSMVLLTVFTLFCYALVVGLFKFMESRAVAGDTVSSPLASVMRTVYAPNVTAPTLRVNLLPLNSMVTEKESWLSLILASSAT